MSEPLSYFWYRALQSPHGVCLKTDNRISLRVNLQNARREACDASLDSIVIRLSPSVEDELWLVKRERPDAPSA